MGSVDVSDMMNMVQKYEKLAVVHLQYDFRFSNPIDEVCNCAAALLS